LQLVGIAASYFLELSSVILHRVRRTEVVANSAGQDAILKREPPTIPLGEPMIKGSQIAKRFLNTGLPDKLDGSVAMFTKLAMLHCETYKDPSFVLGTLCGINSLESSGFHCPSRLGFQFQAHYACSFLMVL